LEVFNSTPRGTGKKTFLTVGPKRNGDLLWKDWLGKGFIYFWKRVFGSREKPILENLMGIPFKNGIFPELATNSPKYSGGNFFREEPFIPHSLEGYPEGFQGHAF